MKKISLTNDFHNTSATLHPQMVTSGRFTGYYRISRRSTLRLRSKLCGSTDCSCGGIFGERGGLPLDVVAQTADCIYMIDLAQSHE